MSGNTEKLYIIIIGISETLKVVLFDVSGANSHGVFLSDIFVNSFVLTRISFIIYYKIAVAGTSYHNNHHHHHHNSSSASKPGECF